MPKRTKTNRGKLAQLRSRLMNMSRVSIIVGVVVGGAAAYAVASLSFADQNPDCLNNKTAAIEQSSFVKSGNTVTVSFKMPYECYTDAVNSLVDKQKVREKAHKEAYDKAIKQGKNKAEANKIADKAGENAVAEAIAKVQDKAREKSSRTVTLAAYAIQDGDWRNDGENQIQVAAKTLKVYPPVNVGKDSAIRKLSIDIPAKACAYQIDLFRMPSAPKNPTQSSGQHNLGAIVYNNGVPCADKPVKTPPVECPNGVAPNADGSCPKCEDGSPMPADKKCPGATCPSGKPMPANGKCEDGKPPVTCDNGKPVPKSGKCDVPDDDNTVTLVSADTPLGKNGPSALPDTGPGAVIATFVGVTALSSLAFEVVSSRLKI